MPARESSEIKGSLVSITKQDARLLLEAGYLWMDMGQFEKARSVALLIRRGDGALYVPLRLDGN